MSDWTEERANDLLTRYAAGEKMKDLAVEYDISPSRVSAIIHKRWSAKRIRFLESQVTELEAQTAKSPLSEA